LNLFFLGEAKLLNRNCFGLLKIGKSFIFESGH
jgi:hypothetical protein